MDTTFLAYFAIAALVLVAAAGAPLPVSGALTAAGILAAAAKLDLVVLVVVATAGAVAGDMVGYATGQIGGHWLQQRKQAHAPWLEWLHVHVLGAKSIRQIVAWCDALLRGRGGMSMALLLSRTVLAAFGPVINVLSGARRYPLRQFLLLDLLGELLWAGAYIGMGFVAGSQGSNLGEIMTNPFVVVSLILLTVGPMIVTVWMRRQTLSRPLPAMTDGCTGD